MNGDGPASAVMLKLSVGPSFSTCTSKTQAPPGLMAWLRVGSGPGGK